MDKIERGKQAVEKLEEAERLLSEAYKQLVSDGVSAASAKSLCRAYIKSAFDSVDAGWAKSN